jgi:5-methylthioribose kinase
LEDAFSKFKTDNAENVPGDTFALLEQCIPLIRQFELQKVQRVQENQITTILHRDAHLKNFLYPRVTNAETRIVDWQFWDLGIGAFDLRHLLGSAFTPKLRRYQKELVRYYHQVFMKDFDVNYSWETCWSDYCKGIVDNLFMPVWQYTGFGWDFRRWEKTLKSAVENFCGLKCDQFL